MDNFDSDYGPSLEIGKHPARAVGGALGTADTGTDQVAVEFEFVDGANKGQRIAWYGYFTEKAEERTIKSLRIAGFQGDDLSDLSSLGRADTPVVQLVLEESEYNGNVSVKVAWVNALGGVGLKKPMDEDQAKSFAERMKGRLAAIEGRKAAPQQRRTPARQAPPSAPQQLAQTRPDDDIPF